MLSAWSMIDILESRKQYVFETGEDREDVINAYDDIITFIRHRAAPTVSIGWQKEKLGAGFGEYFCPYCGRQVRYLSFMQMKGTASRTEECPYRYCPHCGKRVLT